MNSLCLWRFGTNDRSAGALPAGYNGDMAKPAVLIVDDEPDLCELLSITLRRMDLDSRTANTIADAQRQLKAEHVDLCLTDMQLPDGDGLELVKWIQQY
jgi:two-component system response regulator PilR (NtrC family)